MASGQAVQGLQVATVSSGAVGPTGRPQNAAGPALPPIHPPTSVGLLRGGLSTRKLGLGELGQ